MITFHDTYSDMWTKLKTEFLKCKFKL